MYMFAQRVSFQEDITLTKEIISSINVFRSLSPEQIQILLSMMRVRHCRPGSRIYSAGDQPTEIYILLNGRVDFVVERAAVHRIVDTFGTGELLGETAALGVQQQVGTAIASSIDVELLVLSKKALLKLQKREPELFSILMKNIEQDADQKKYLVSQ